MSNKNLTVIKDEHVGQFLQKFSKGLTDYAFRKYNYSAFIKSAMLAIANNKQLRECLKTDSGKMSLFNALRYAATTGLSLNPQEGKAAIVSYTNKEGKIIVQYQVMKNGMIELAMESGQVEWISCDLVRENDDFKLKKSTQGDEYEFIPALKDRGEILGFFAALKFKDGSTHICWMTKEEIEEHRDKYAAFKGDNSAWIKSFAGMGIKTVLKRLLRNLSINEDVDRAIGADDQYEGDTIEISQNGFSADDVIDDIKKTENKEKVDSIDTKIENSPPPRELF